MCVFGTHFWVQVRMPIKKAQQKRREASKSFSHLSWNGKRKENVLLFLKKVSDDDLIYFSYCKYI